MEKEEIKRLLEEAKKKLGIKEELRVILQPMKRKIASVSLKNKTIRINKAIIHTLNEEQMRYILVHELIHYKLKHYSHDNSFMNELRQFYDEDEIETIERSILSKIITSNQNRNRNHVI